MWCASLNPDRLEFCIDSQGPGLASFLDEALNSGLARRNWDPVSRRPERCLCWYIGCFFWVYCFCCFEGLCYWWYLFCRIYYDALLSGQCTLWFCDLSVELKMRSIESIWDAFEIVEAPHLVSFHLEYILSQAVIFHISGKEAVLIKISCLLD